MLEVVKHNVQFCVIGGGLAGMCAAIAAARHGVKTLLMHERPMLGGNASSEVRMWVCGTPGMIETGLIEELRLENLYRNTTPCYSVWDSILYEKARFQENLTLLLNCSCQAADCKEGKLLSVTGYQQTTQTFHQVEASFFADCSGDSILIPLTGAEYRWGRECKEEFDETLAQDKADGKTMGLSCILQARETASPQKYIPPSWAYTYPDDASLPPREYVMDRFQNYWYLELGGDRNTIRDTEEIRDELLKIAFGLWDHMKNHGDHGLENWTLDWVGFLPGKRESRRYVGDYILTEKDILSGRIFEDAVAYGGWPVDDHHPGGFNYFGEPNLCLRLDKPYTVPLRSLYSVNISNLFCAGRNISTTHVALSSSRVMATCALLGQAVGTAAFYAVDNNCGSNRETAERFTKEIRQTLLDDDCFIPGYVRDIPEVCRKAELQSSGGAGAENLRSGLDRQIGDEMNAWSVQKGAWAEYTLAEKEFVREIRIAFDSDLKRDHLNMVSNYTLIPAAYKVPETLVQKFRVEVDGEVIFREENNHQRFAVIPCGKKCSSIRLVIEECRQEPSGVFRFDFC